MLVDSVSRKQACGRATVISRRDIVVGTIVAGALLPSPAFACKAPAAKDRDGYTRVIDRLFEAWWARDFIAFQQAFQYPERKEQFDARTLFDAHFAKQERRFRGELLFNGASVATQVITPQEADPAFGVCGGFAVTNLFLVRFLPGRDTPVVNEAKHVDANLLLRGNGRTYREHIDNRLSSNRCLRLATVRRWRATPDDDEYYIYATAILAEHAGLG
jgi:hypothetical protein